jgi:hypothetical protein
MTSEAANPEAAGTFVPARSWPFARSWLGAALLTAAAIYGPQLSMCLYTQGFVACSHCKAGVWQVAPIAPGLFFYETGRRLLNLPHFSSAVGIAFVIVLSLLIFAGLTAGVRRAGRWWAAILIPVALASGFIAFAILSAMRM